MALVGKTFWSLPRIDATNRWCLAWRDGQQPRILVTEEIHLLVVATWHSSLLHMDLVEIKDFKEMPVETGETEEVEIFVETIKEIGLMVAELTSMRMPVVVEPKTMPALGLHSTLLLTRISSQSLALMDSPSMNH